MSSTYLLDNEERLAGSGIGPSKHTNWSYKPPPGEIPVRANLQVTEISGGGALNVSIEHAESGTWAEVGSFPAVSTPWTSEEIVLNFVPSDASKLRAVWSLSAGRASFHCGVKK